MAPDVMNSFDLNGKVAVITGGGGALCGTMAIALGSIGSKISAYQSGNRRAL